MLNLDKTDLIDNILIITNDDGSINCIPKDSATDNELSLFEEFEEAYPNGKIAEISLDEVKQNKINEMSAICENKIINEFYSSCLGESKRFDCTLIDQTNIIGLVAKAQMIIANAITDNTLEWKATGEPVCYPWTHQQVLTLGTDLFAHKTEKIKRYELLREYIKTLDTCDSVNKITWETEIPSPETTTSEK
ncbi:hypothetical protein [Clostridium beijerinckii]|uniref:DUF4376 domain-containing protein n=1 Tax=Clostridium beijerinckii TaxID=1520 RepID=A0AAX0AWS3_CLOBE|nr:hypothetical protein [Clostridium beijerinckii]NRT86543.1 hypothetical protein [Clostridium beijerinckii]NYC71975.1 hypothetical protein [Clostridium beijerinckii]